MINIILKMQVHLYIFQFLQHLIKIYLNSKKK